MKNSAEGSEHPQVFYPKLPPFSMAPSAKFGFPDAREPTRVNVVLNSKETPHVLWLCSACFRRSTLAQVIATEQQSKDQTVSLNRIQVWPHRKEHSDRKNDPPPFAVPQVPHAVHDRPDAVV
jgi:hypothetical protein